MCIRFHYYRHCALAASGRCGEVHWPLKGGGWRSFFGGHCVAVCGSVSTTLLHLRVKYTASSTQNASNESVALPSVESTSEDPTEREPRADKNEAENNNSNSSEQKEGGEKKRRSIKQQLDYFWYYLCHDYLVDFGYEILILLLLLSIYISMDQLVGVYCFLFLVGVILVGRWRLTVREGAVFPQLFVVITIVPILILYLFRLGLPPSIVTGCPFQPSLCSASHTDYALYMGLTSSPESLESIAFLCAVIFWLRIVRDQVPQVRARSPLYLQRYQALGDWLQLHEEEVYLNTFLHKVSYETNITKMISQEMETQNLAAIAYHCSYTHLAWKHRNCTLIVW